MRLHQYIFVNGPRRSGKDTAVRFINKEWLNVRHRKFATPLKEACASLFGVSPTLLKELEREGSVLKTEPCDLFFGKSWVEVLIWLSEEVMKPKFGPTVFGDLMATNLCAFTATPFTVISDCGFVSEVLPVIKLFGVRNCHVIRLFRPGHTFEGDSRQYLFENDAPIGLNILDLHNTYDLPMFRIQVLRRIDRIMGREKEYDA